MDDLSFELVRKPNDLDSLERAFVDADAASCAQRLCDLWLSFLADNYRLDSSPDLRTIFDALGVAFLRLTAVFQQRSDSHYELSNNQE